MIFLYEPIIIYKVNSATELKELNNKFLVRILDKECTFAWNAEEMDHSHAKEVLKPYVADIEDYEGFMLDKDVLICSILKYGKKSLRHFSQKFFQKIEKTDFGYKVKWY